MIKKFKIRASSGGQIMGLVGRPTEIQLARIVELETKKKDKALTEAQQKELDGLVAKRDAKPVLSDGGKTYCQMWLKEQLYNRRKEFGNKYTEKGNQCEQAGIEMVADKMGYGLISKNEQSFEDEFMTGTPDLVLSEFVEDIKNSWSPFTFPLFAKELPESDYFYQLQIYMHLTGKKKAAVNYTLIDTPVSIMDAEARRDWYKEGNVGGEIPMEYFDPYYEQMTYRDVPDKLKFKRFEFDYDQNVIKTIQQRVELCREYIKTIVPEFITEPQAE